MTASRYSPWSHPLDETPPAHCRAMVRCRRRTAASLLPAVGLVILSLHGAPATAEAAGTAGITVGATVRSYARIETARLPSDLTLVQADVDRGWIDLPHAAHLRVRTNSPQGYELVLTTRDGPVWLVEVSSVSGSATFAPPGGVIVRPAAGFRREELDLDFRLHLAEGTRPGRYAWPIALSVRPRGLRPSSARGPTRPASPPR
ncbi:MAG: hypothetical protein ACE5IK_01975 [Acidobacteriota bacterium]